MERRQKIGLIMIAVGVGLVLSALIQSNMRCIWTVDYLLRCSVGVTLVAASVFVSGEMDTEDKQPKSKKKNRR